MDESSADVQAEAQKPQNSQDYEDCPKHVFLLAIGLRWKSFQELTESCGSSDLARSHFALPIFELLFNIAHLGSGLHGSDLPHSRHDDLDREVISPQKGHIRCDPKPAISGFSLVARREAFNFFSQ